MRSFETWIFLAYIKMRIFLRDNQFGIIIIIFSINWENECAYTHMHNVDSITQKYGIFVAS